MSYDDYLRAAAELSSLHAGDVSSAAQRDTWVTGQRAELDELGARLARQRTSLENVATLTKLPVTFPAVPVQHLSGTDVASAMTAARTDASAADDLVTETDYLAHRAPLLPRWRTDERNALVYLAYAALALLLQIGVLVNAASNEDTLSGRGWVAFWAIVLPLLAFGAGWLTIGVACRPRLGEEKLVRNPRLGLIVCLSTWLVVCSIGGQVLF
ncbi:hypothetical protein Afil01_25370 [Actinorhabdospora filicis]|uniref:Uncharacterized protein n=1 Tax=Actinorhabdospora filicis TaxID=1785913 RepID=A0A9W6SKS8_9ACTN|nr:hypothetical protein [Actinorhabdospora filicis]GLZ77730.1 hypothetical protein Afil01_25370 [Actinorhabdospora filicis]